MRLQQILFSGVLLVLPAFPQSNGNWSFTPRHPTPSPRSQQCLAYDSAHGHVLMTGGKSNVMTSGSTVITFLTDVWAWDGALWTQIATAHSYPIMGGCAYDAAHGQLVVLTATNVFFPSVNQTWLFDGTDWSLASPKHSPPPREFFSMAYDAARGQVVMFGGVQYNSNSGTLADTWVWDGSDWTQKNPANSPPSRQNAGMDYDSVRGQIVLFGGETITTKFTVQNDTWTWDGSNWTQQNPATSPSPRTYPEMAFDSAHGHLVLFGGTDPSINLLGDTWLWDGSNWTQQSPQNSPVPTESGTMAFDAGHDQAVYFGGVDPQNNLSNTTTLWSEGAPTVTQPVVTSVIGASGFGGLPLVGSGSWIEIYGYDLSALTRQWAGSDFNGNSAPTSLSGVQVSIGGQPAFVEYVAAGSSTSQGQLNVQVPAGVSAGVQQLIVKNGGATGQPFSVNVASVAPGLLAPSSFVISGKQYLVAQFPDNVTYVLPTGAIPGVASRPAKANDTIIFYGVGFGGVTPASAPGQIVAQQNQLAQPFQLSIGGTPVTFTYDGLAPGFVGLYQFDAVVPAVSPNALVPVTFKLNGAPGSQTLYIPISQ